MNTGTEILDTRVANAQYGMNTGTGIAWAQNGHMNTGHTFVQYGMDTGTSIQNRPRGQHWVPEFFFDWLTYQTAFRQLV